MPKISTLFRNALDAFGPLSPGEAAPSELIATFRGRLPSSLLDFWEVYGFGLWLNGYFQFCNPERYRPVLEMVFDNDEAFKASRSHAIGFSSLGKLLVWNEDYRIMAIDTLYHRVACAGYFKTADVREDTVIGVAVGNVDGEVYDAPDDRGKLLFKRLLKKHGAVDFGQIYAPSLHPALGGSVLAENFRPVSALESMAIAAQAGRFALYDTTKPQVPQLRLIGA